MGIKYDINPDEYRFGTSIREAKHNRLRGSVGAMVGAGIGGLPTGEARSNAGFVTTGARAQAAAAAGAARQQHGAAVAAAQDRYGKERERVDALYGQSLQAASALAVKQQGDYAALGRVKVAEYMGAQAAAMAEHTTWLHSISGETPASLAAITAANSYISGGRDFSHDMSDPEILTGPDTMAVTKQIYDSVESPLERAYIRSQVPWLGAQGTMMSSGATPSGNSASSTDGKLTPYQAVLMQRTEDSATLEKTAEERLAKGQLLDDVITQTTADVEAQGAILGQNPDVAKVYGDLRHAMGAQASVQGAIDADPLVRQTGEQATEMEARAAATPPETNREAKGDLYNSQELTNFMVRNGIGDRQQGMRIFMRSTRAKTHDVKKAGRTGNPDGLDLEAYATASAPRVDKKKEDGTSFSSGDAGGILSKAGKAMQSQSDDPAPGASGKDTKTEVQVASDNNVNKAEDLYELRKGLRNNMLKGTRPNAQRTNK